MRDSRKFLSSYCQKEKIEDIKREVIRNCKFDNLCHFSIGNKSMSKTQHYITELV
jgi:hypothetical protein